MSPNCIPAVFKPSVFYSHRPISKRNRSHCQFPFVKAKQKKGQKPASSSYRRTRADLSTNIRATLGGDTTAQTEQQIVHTAATQTKNQHSSSLTLEQSGGDQLDSGHISNKHSEVNNKQTKNASEKMDGVLYANAPGVPLTCTSGQTPQGISPRTLENREYGHYHCQIENHARGFTRNGHVIEGPEPSHTVHMQHMPIPSTLHDGKAWHQNELLAVHGTPSTPQTQADTKSPRNNNESTLETNHVNPVEPYMYRLEFQSEKLSKTIPVQRLPYSLPHFNQLTGHEHLRSYQFCKENMNKPHNQSRFTDREKVEHQHDSWNTAQTNGFVNNETPPKQFSRVDPNLNAFSRAKEYHLPGFPQESLDLSNAPSSIRIGQTSTPKVHPGMSTNNRDVVNGTRLESYNVEQNSLPNYAANHFASPNHTNIEVRSTSQYRYQGQWPHGPREDSPEVHQNESKRDRIPDFRQRVNGKVSAAANVNTPDCFVVPPTLPKSPAKRERPSTSRELRRKKTIDKSEFITTAVSWQSNLLRTEGRPNRRFSRYERVSFAGKRRPSYVQIGGGSVSSLPEELECEELEATELPVISNVTPKQRLSLTSPGEQESRILTRLRSKLSPSRPRVFEVITLSDSEDDSTREKKKPARANSQNDVHVANEILKKMSLAEGMASSKQLPPCPYLEPLTQSDEEFVTLLFTCKPKQELSVIPSANIVLRGEDFKRLRGVRWLNDEIINAYMSLMNVRNEAIFRELTQKEREGIPRTFVFNSYFYTRLRSNSEGFDFNGVRRWTNRAGVKVTRFDLLLFPVNLGNHHWVLAGIDLSKRTFFYLDSMSSGDRCNVLGSLRKWLEHELRDKHVNESITQTSMESWDFIYNKYVIRRVGVLPKSLEPAGSRSNRTARVPRQTDGGSCGVFMAKMADCLSLGVKIYFNQKSIPLLRRRMALDLFRGRLSM